MNLGQGCEAERQLTKEGSQQQRRLAWLATAFASASIIALGFHIFGWMRMPLFLQIAGFPAVLALFSLAAYGRWIKARMFLDSLSLGAWAGFVASLVYDGIRLLLERSHVFGYNGFVPIQMFGNWITGQPMYSPAATIAGWTYHFWNGTMFGVMYSLMMGPRHWLFGVAYGVVMECCMLGLFPLFLRVSNRVDFIALSMIGHIAYGAVLGLLVQKYTAR